MSLVHPVGASRDAGGIYTSSGDQAHIRIPVGSVAVHLNSLDVETVSSLWAEVFIRRRVWWA